jgi:hypothetical protein
VIDFDDYKVRDYWPDEWVPKTGKEARTEFGTLVDEIPLRRAELKSLLRRNGLENSDASSALQAVNEWFLDNVSADTSGVWPAFPWRSFVLDIGLQIGEAVRVRHPHVRWELATTGPKSEGYRQPVLVGFRQPGYQRFRVCPSAVLFTYATRAVKKDGVMIALIDGKPMQFALPPIKRERFVQLMEALEEMA